MKRRLALLLALSALAGSPPLAVHARQDASERPVYTKDRLSDAQMETLVAGPMQRVRDGDVAGGERAFAAQLEEAVRRSGIGSVEVADRLTAFGVLLYGESGDNSVRARARAATYLLRAIDSYRSAFGPAHPEVAVALHSYAIVLIALNEDDPPATAQTALEEAYRIREAALGRSNSETLDALLELAGLSALPSRTRGDPGRIAAAAALYRQGLGYARAATGQSEEELPVTWQLGLARLYARHHQLAAAMAAVAEAERSARDEIQCPSFVTQVLRLVDVLYREGYPAEAQALGERYLDLACPEPAERGPIV